MLLSHMILSRSLNGGVQLTKNTRRQKKKKKRKKTDIVEFCIRNCIYMQAYKQNDDNFESMQNSRIHTRAHGYTHTHTIQYEYKLTRYFRVFCALFLVAFVFPVLRRTYLFTLESHSKLNTKQIDTCEWDTL